MRRISLPRLLLPISLFVSGPIAAQEEAPEALFELEVGDAEVDFYLEGSWDAALSGSLGFVVDPAGALIFPSPFPGLEGGQLFRQVPNLTFSVWLMQRYFLEASVVGDFTQKDYDYFDQNYILAGYRGEEGEFLRQVLFGNRDIGIGAYPFIEIPAAGGSSLGASAQLATGISSHELLLRFDNNEQDRIVFIGKNRVSEQTIPLDEYQRGRFFRLPDTGVEDLAVYLEDPDGSDTGTDSGGHSRRYRLATAEDAAIDAAAGTVSLAQPAEGAVLVYYTDIGVAGGTGGLPGESGGLIDPTSASDFSWGATWLGQPMTERQVTIDLAVDLDCLRLYQPGEFSPFEMLGVYALEQKVPEELSRLRVSLVRKGSASLVPDGAPRPRLTPGADHVAFEYEDGTTRYRREFYPFLDANDGPPLSDPPIDPDNQLYGPGADTPAGYLVYEILASHLTPVGDYRISTDIVPGSVQVFRNGGGESRFEVDYAQGLLTFFTEIAPNDRLEVHFRRQLSLAGNGDLLFAWGNSLAASEALSVQLAAGVRWNLLPGTFTEESYSRTGGVVLSAGAQGQAGPLSYRAQAGVSFTNPDTTGTMRLLGMEQTGVEVPLSEDTAWPAAAPADDGPFGVATLDQDNRGRLLYKDFRSYGLLGNSTLMPYTWTPPAEQVLPYETGSKPGPYVAAGSFDGTTTGRSLVLDLALDDAQWVGVQLPVLPETGLADLAAYRGISLRYRMVDFQRTGTAECTVYLQLGEIGENLDGDSALDAEATASAAGFSFDDSGNGATLQVGSSPKKAGNGRRDSEDVDGNGVLDPEANEWIVTLADAPVLNADTGWEVLQYTFSAAERAKLRRTRSLRLLVVESGGGPGDSAAGRLLVDHLSLEGSPFSVVVDDGADVTVTVREVEEQFLSPAAPAPLPTVHPEVSDVFHPFGERQKVLAIQWDGGTADDWEVKGYVRSPTEGIDYREIVYYYHLATSDAGTPSFALRDNEGDAITWDLPAGSTTGWSKVRVSLDDGRVYVNGADTGSVSGTLAGASIVVFAVSLDGALDGALYLDELHLSDPRGAVGAGAVADFELTLPGELLSVGGHSMVRDLTLRQEAAATTAGFSGLYGEPLSDGSFSSRSELAVGLSAVDLSADLTLRATGGEVEAGGGHGLSVPHQPFPVRFTDAFRLDRRAGGRELSRGNTLSLDLPPLVALDLEASAGSLENTLSQRWLTRLLLTPGPVSLDSRLELSQSGEGFELPDPDGGYLANWLLGYGLIAPWRGGEPGDSLLERKGSLALNWSLATAPVGLQVLGSYGFHSFDLNDPSRSLRGNLALDLSVPVIWRAGQLTRFSLTPGYRRSLSLRGAAAGSGDFAGDLGSSLAWLCAQDYAFAALPFVELYDADTAALFDDRTGDFSEALFESEGYLRLSRRVSSRLLDLVLPSAAELALGRTLKRAGDLTTDLNLYTLSSRTTALNLFGSLGAYSLFSFYRTDEFSSSVSATLRAEGGEPADGQLLVEHFASFEGEKGSQLTLSNRYSGRYDTAWSGGDTVELLYTWERRPPDGVRLPLLPASLGQAGYWTHLESLALEAEGPRGAQGSTGEGSFHPVNLILTHESSVILPEHGFLKASLSVGFDLEQTADRELYKRFGLQGALEVRIEF